MLKMLKKTCRSQRGFTLIELMIVISIIGILASIAAPSYQRGIIKAREAVLLENLYSINSSIDQFYADKGKYPSSLEELKDEKYLKSIPKDPFTKKDDWTLKSPPQSDPPEEGVYEVSSSSTLIGSNGKPYSEWPVQ
jgi:general secretion pathway protein G